MTLDEESIGRSNPDVEHERTIAIYDLLEQNSLRAGRPRGRALRAASVASTTTGWCSTSASRTARPWSHICFRSSPLRRIVKDYYMICDSYYQAIRTATPDKHRGHRHGPARHPQRRFQYPDRAC